MVLAFGWFAISGFALMEARASVVSDIPEQLNNALFDGGSLFAAQALLTAGIMCSAGLALAVARMPPAGMFVVLFCVLGSLTAIGWADVSLMIVAIFIAVGMFGKTMYEWVGGGGAQGD